MTQIMKNIGQKLANIRKDSGLNQKELAKAVKRSSSYLCRIENGERLPTPELVYQILKVCSQHAKWSQDEYQGISKEIDSDLRKINSAERKPIIETPNKTFFAGKQNNEFVEFADFPSSLNAMAEIIREQKEAINVHILAAGGGVTLVNTLTTIMHNSQVPTNISAYLVNQESPIVDFYPKYWLEQAKSVRVLLNDIQQRDKASKFSLNLYLYDFLPVLRGVLINKEHLFLGFFGWHQNYGLSGSVFPHRYYERSYENSEYYFQTFENWIENMPNKKVETML